MLEHDCHLLRAATARQLLEVSFSICYTNMHVDERITDVYSTNVFTQLWTTYTGLQVTDQLLEKGS